MHTSTLVDVLSIQPCLDDFAVIESPATLHRILSLGEDSADSLIILTLDGTTVA